ncbi:MAG: glycerol kinase GlpK [Abitibacteriaceae bacterium]|nr:glycerol kinase GlpK [Abditibacteriaceae bacterium]MBV9866089.1 glycerol kinase GlpK [Abditibacteriaceae bacterium]
MPQSYILAIDQGTTGTRVIIFDHDGAICGQAYAEFTQYYPQPGWVEHDTEEIWAATIGLAAQALAKAGISAEDVQAIGITNQRETTLLWDRQTGQPIAPAIVWQDRRTASICDELKTQGLEEDFRSRTGLVLDAYFSGTKVAWLLNHHAGLRARAQNGEIAFGTIDSWLVWKLSGGQTHITDYTNASRTLLFNIHDLQWDAHLLEVLGIPPVMLPTVVPSAGICAHTSPAVFFGQSIPVAGIAGDQQAALFGQGCYEAGLAKNTYGTGSFLLLHTGQQPVTSKAGLLTTIAWRIGDDPVEYALEGSVFVTGAAVQWLRDGLGIIGDAAETEALARSLASNEGVYFVPALAGLGAPHWDAYARGAIVGLTRGTTRAHLARAALESICYQTRDIVEAMAHDSGIPLKQLRADGGAVANSFLMQFQADILGVPVDVPEINETTALGAAYLAGLATGFWKGREELQSKWKLRHHYEPGMVAEHREQLHRRWLRAVERAKSWADD